jgi:hypothetical protein
LYAANRWDMPGLERTIARLVATVGAEGGFLFQVHHWMHPEINDIDSTLQGWPWRPGTASWIEPTAHTVIALRNIAAWLGRRNTPSYLGLTRRVHVAQQMIVSRRASDGGWNCGTRRVWDVDVPSYPETTALALIALRGIPDIDLNSSLTLGRRYAAETRSALARAWLQIALPMYGVTVAAQPSGARPSQDILLAAVQCIAEDGSGQRFFSTATKAAEAV